MPTPPSTTQVVKTTAEFQKALKNPAVKNIALDASIGTVGDVFTVNHIVNINLNNRVLTGALIIDTDKQGTITLSAGTVDGGLTIDASQVSFVNNATVTGDTNIVNVAPNTFENNGDLQGTVIISDTDGTRFVNKGKTGVIDVATNEAVTLEGSFTSEIKLTKAAKVTVPSDTSIAQLTVASSADGAEVSNNGTVTELKADTAVKVTGNQPSTVTGTGNVTGDSVLSAPSNGATEKDGLTGVTANGALFLVYGLNNESGQQKPSTLTEVKNHIENTYKVNFNANAIQVTDGKIALTGSVLSTGDWNKIKANGDKTIPYRITLVKDNTVAGNATGANKVIKVAMYQDGKAVLNAVNNDLITKQ